MPLAEECKSAGFNLDEPCRPRKRGMERGWGREMKQRSWEKVRSFGLPNASSLESKCGRVSLTFNGLPIGANAARCWNTTMARARLDIRIITKYS